MTTVQKNDLKLIWKKTILKCCTDLKFEIMLEHDYVSND